MSLISGQTLKYVGLWLRTQVFTHGQIYVACSRVGKPENLKFAVKQAKNGYNESAANIVFTQVLLKS